MKKQFSILSVLVLLILFTGCATLTAGGENVKVTNKASDVQNCTLKGKVRSHGGGSPLIRARNVAAEEWNANIVLLDDLGAETIAMAYACN